MKDWALELNSLSDYLVRDPEFYNNQEREEVRRLIQNNMDTSRYAHPYLTNLTKIALPLQMTPPRTLMVQEDHPTAIQGRR